MTWIKMFLRKDILMKHSRTYHPDSTCVAFPLGGIGTGNISLGARGDLRDWEIFNSSNKGNSLPNTLFAIWCQSGESSPVCKVLEGPIQPPYPLSHGFHPWTASGLPRCQDTVFKAEYPFAQIKFIEPDLPVEIKLEAFTPLVPLHPDESGLPCAILTFTAQNTSPEVVSLTIAGSLINPVGQIAYDQYGNISTGGLGQNVNELRLEDDFHGIFLHSEKYSSADLLYGNLSLVTTYPTITSRRAWLRGAWYDFLRDFWDDFSTDGRLDDPGYETPSPSGQTDTATLGVYDTLKPGETQAYRFILTWYFPNRPKSWKSPTNPHVSQLIRNHYALYFNSSWAVARHLIENMDHLEGMTRKFHESLFSSTLPESVLGALSANIVPIRSNTCFWHEDGRFYGYEGCFDTHGCCDGSCTHVWSYAQTAAFLFPSLERQMRETEFVLETEADGYMSFRTYKTFSEQFVWSWGDQKPEAAVDGQMGSILRVLREWQLSRDRAWLERVWPGVKRALFYARQHWDTDGDGVLDGRQHNTYDIEFYGPNPLCSIYYLAGLRAVEELAKVMDEPDLADECHAAFIDSSKKVDAMLWNGEYFSQILQDVNQYKYQHGEGCLSDQLLGQLYARILDLGDLLDVEHIRSAARSIHHYNFKSTLRDHVNCQRTYALNDEAGLILCTWPRGGRPRQPFVYSDEVWTGIEYQVAAGLIYEGLVDEGLEIVRAVRDRHDGKRRNPWDEVECGHHYARSMSSWALLLALSGFHYDAHRGQLSFAPVISPEDFRCFFSTGSGWGIYSQSLSTTMLEINLELQAGYLDIQQLTIPVPGMADRAEIALENDLLPANFSQSAEKVTVYFPREFQLTRGRALRLQVFFKRS
jgi:uncharacterized protein (DUF608 family)